MRGHFVLVRARLLPSGRFRREGGAVHQHSPVADHVLLADIRNYTVDIAGGAAAGQVPAVYDVPGRAVGAHHHRYTEHALPQAVHSQDGAVGKAHLHPPTAKDPADEGTQAGQRRGRGAHEGTLLL